MECKTILNVMECDGIGLNGMKRNGIECDGG
jgi:hypothetical protein